MLGLPRSLQFTENGRVIELAAQIPPDQTHRAREEEGQPPAPQCHGIPADDGLNDEYQESAQGEAAKCAELEEAAAEAALVVRGVLRHERGRPAILSTGGEALNHAQGDEADGGPDANGRVGGQEADGERGSGHQDDCGGKDRSSADAVAERPPEQATERSDEEGDGEDREATERGRGRVVAGEECLADMDGDIRVDAIVEPLHGVAHR